MSSLPQSKIANMTHAAFATSGTNSDPVSGKGIGTDTAITAEMCGDQIHDLLFESWWQPEKLVNKRGSNPSKTTKFTAFIVQKRNQLNRAAGVDVVVFCLLFLLLLLAMVSSWLLSQICSNAGSSMAADPIQSMVSNYRAHNVCLRSRYQLVLHYMPINLVDTMYRLLDQQ